MKHGGSLTINPETGLPEAGFLDKLLPAIIGFAVTATTGIPAWQVGLGVGAVETARTGDLGKGISAGLGAYGGAGLGMGLSEAGATTLNNAAGQSYLSTAPGALADAGAGLSADMVANLENAGASTSGTMSAAQQAAIDKAATATPFDKLSAGFNAAKTNPSSLLTKDNFKYLAAGAAPILADQAVKANLPTTTTRPGEVHRFSYNPYNQYYTPVGNYEVPVKSAAGGGLMGMNSNGYNPGELNFSGGGDPIVRMAEGGLGSIAHFAAGGDAALEAYQAGNYEEANRLLGAAGMSAQDVVSKYGLSQADAATVAKNLGYAGDMSGIQYAAPPAQQAAAQQTATTTTTESPADAIARIGREQAETARIARENLAALQPTNTTTTTGGGLATLANPTGAGTTGVTTTGGGLATLADTAGATTTGATTTGRPTAEQAAATVATVYRNVLGRDPDPNGMAYWTQQLTSGNQDSATMYADFIRGAQANKETGNFGLSLADAQKAYTGYSSADASNIADEWVRNVLGREVTDADRKTQWYKDAVNKDVMNTYAKAENIYNNFRDYAGLQTGSPVSNLDLYQASKLMGPQAKTTVTGGGGNDVIVPSGYHLENGLIVKNIDATQHTSTVEDTPTNLYTAPATSLPVGIAGNTGPSQIGGGATVNPNGTITSSPLIPGIPVGGFTGMEQVRDAYTKGGGRLGYVPYAPKTMDEFNTKYNKLTGGSKAAYDTLMGKIPYSPKPVTETGEIMKPYAESVLGVPMNKASKQYLYDPDTRKYTLNPDFIPVSYTDKGEKVYGLSSRDIASQLPDVAKSDYEKWMKDNNVTLAQIAQSLNISLAEAKKRYPTAGSTTDSGTNTATAVDTTDKSKQPSGDYVWSDAYNKWVLAKEGGLMATGGLAALTMARGGATRMPFFSKSTGKFNSAAPQVYADGGMSDHYNLGGYSDGGRLLRGPGDGVSDSIPATIGNKRPARLADGEFVVPARIVSELGNGSTEAGARKLYAMMDRVQAARKGSIGKGRVANNSRADKYLPV
jgi:hypothetical protein